MKQDLLIPKLTSNDESIKVVEWLVTDRDYVQIGQSVLLVETSKTNVEIESEYCGYIRHACSPEQILNVAGLYGLLFDSIEELEAFQPEKVDQVFVWPEPTDPLTSNFSNAALQYIKQHRLNPADFHDLGLVNVEKIKAKLKEKDNQLLGCDKKSFPNACIEEVPFSKLAEINTLSKNREGQITSSLTVQLESAAIRAHLAGVVWLNRRILPYILYVFSRLLSENPYFLSYYRDRCLVLYNKINLGLAVDLGKGLRVMIVEDPERLTLFDLQLSLVDSITNYYESAMSPTLQVSTVTVTDLSQDNILHFQPVLNANQSVILGIGGDQTLPGSPLTLTLVFDHRVLSGQTVALFLKQFKEKLLTEYQCMDLNEGALMESLYD